jgi:hypothetical protein
MEILYELGKCSRLTMSALTPYFQREQINVTEINFQPGTLKEITEVLTKMGNSPTDQRYVKLPGIFPITPYDISYPRGQELRQWKGTILVVMSTDPNIRRLQRENLKFTPVLKPIAEEMIRQMCNNSAFHTYGFSDISYRLIEHDYWSKEKKANVFNEYVDVLEIRDLTINLSPSTNC